MIRSFTLPIAVLSMAILSSCLAARSDDVRLMIERRSELDGQNVSVSGILRVRNGLLNLFSDDGNRCIGLLATDDQRRHFSQYNGRRISINGTLRSEGCGSGAICVESLCGPTVISNFSAMPR
jgi:hypothetical protein